MTSWASSSWLNVWRHLRSTNSDKYIWTPLDSSWTKIMTRWLGFLAQRCLCSSHIWHESCQVFSGSESSLKIFVSWREDSSFSLLSYSILPRPADSIPKGGGQKTCHGTHYGGINFSSNHCTKRVNWVQFNEQLPRHLRVTNWEGGLVETPCTFVAMTKNWRASSWIYQGMLFFLD